MKKLALVIVGLLVVGAVYFSVQKSNKTAKGNVENGDGPIYDAKENLLKLTSGGGEPHYKCPNECENSGAEGAGTCPTCGTAYVHNQAFHGASGNPLGLNDSPLPVIDPSSGKATEIGKATATPISTTTTTASTNSGVMHYTCKQGHGGSNTKDQSCGTCGNPYEHNPDYHNNTSSTTPSSPQITTTTSSPSITASPAPATASPSASSASGVLHYTCSKGDGGGSNVRTDKCGKCGGELAHNEAYHS